MAVSFIGGGNRRTRRKPPTCRMSLTNFIMLLYSLPWAGVECKTSVVIGTDCIGSCKSNYHRIMVATAPYSHVEVTGVFSGVRVAQSLNFCALSCRWLFVSLCVFFWSLHCLSFIDLRLLILPHKTSLTSPLFYWSTFTNQGKRVVIYMRVRGIELFHVSTIFRL